MAASVQATKQQIAFYASTPAYRKVLELHGWGDLQSELHRLSLDGRWDAPTRAYTSELAFTSSLTTRGQFRMLWIGDPQVLPLDPVVSRRRSRAGSSRERAHRRSRSISGFASTPKQSTCGAR